MLAVSDWTSYIDTMLSMPFRYSGAKGYFTNGQQGIEMLSDSQSVVHTFLRSVFTLVSTHEQTIRNLLRAQFTPLGTKLLLAFPTLAIFIVRGWRWRLLAVALLCVGLAAIIAPMRLFSHYQQQLIPVFIVGTLLVLRELDTVSSRLAGLFAAWLLAIMLFNVALTAESLRVDHGEQADMNTLARRIDAESQPSDTLLAVGTNSAYLYYRSTIEPCHKFHWDLFFGWLAASLPTDINTVIDTIVALPPVWIAIDHNAREKFLLRPNPHEEGVVRTGHLLRQLNKRYVYKVAHEVGHWIALQRHLDDTSSR
jgi:hypothetical protein